MDLGPLHLKAILHRQSGVPTGLRRNCAHHGDNTCALHSHLLPAPPVGHDTCGAVDGNWVEPDAVDDIPRLEVPQSKGPTEHLWETEVSNDLAGHKTLDSGHHATSLQGENHQILVVEAPQISAGRGLPGHPTA